MTGTAVAEAQANLPAHLQNQLPEATKEFSGGVQSGFPVISYRGKVWRVKISGEEQVYVDPETGDAIQAIEGVLIKSNPTLAKTHYEGKYSEGDSGKPRCWSSNGERPDTDVPNPINPNCAACPMNVWGSRVSDEGKKMKACQDVRRATFVFRHDLEALIAGEKTIDEVPVMLLRVPPASLNPLKDYAERVLAPKGAAPFMLYTRIGFDTDASYPRLTFKGAQWLSEAEFGAISDLRESDVVQRILDTSAEHATGGNTDEGDEAASSESTAKAEAPESAPPEASAQEKEEQYSTPADEEIAPARAAAVEEIAAADDIAPAAPQAQPPAPTPAPPQAEAKSVKPEPAVESPDSGDDDIDDMLSSILD